MYNKLVKTGITMEVEEEEYMDIKGNVIGEYDTKKLGNKTK